MKKGFTLIELLVVIAIIGILVAVSMASYITAQKQARDASRGTILHNVQTAFEQYYAENNAYPTSGTIDSAFDTGSRPNDPKNATPYTINWSSTASDTYCICAKLEAGLGNASNTSCNWNPNGYMCIQNQQ